jgi:hypothetical protein
MSLTYPIDPSLPSNPTPIFSEVTAVRGDHMRADNAQIWGNFDSLQNSKIEVLSSSVDSDIALFDGITGKLIKDSGIKISTDGTFASKVNTLIATVKAVSDYLDSLFYIGFMIDDTGITPPTGFWAPANGDSLIRASYPTLWGRYNAIIGTCTISNGGGVSPAVVHLANHNLLSGDCIAFTSTDSPPSPLGVETKYYVTRVDGDNLKLSTTFANYLTATWINTTNAGSGVHTLRYNPWGIADSTHFNLPDSRGLITVGSGQQGLADWAGVNYLERLGQYKQDFSQKITGEVMAADSGGAVGVIRADTGYAISGALKLGSGAASRRYVVEPGGTANALGFDSSLSVRTSTITSPARVGMNKLVRTL